MCLATNYIHNKSHAYGSCSHALVWKMADHFPEQSESDLNVNNNIIIDY